MIQFSGKKSGGETSDPVESPGCTFTSFTSAASHLQFISFVLAPPTPHSKPGRPYLSSVRARGLLGYKVLGISPQIPRRAPTPWSTRGLFSRWACTWRDI